MVCVFLSFLKTFQMIIFFDAFSQDINDQWNENFMSEEEEPLPSLKVKKSHSLLSIKEKSEEKKEQKINTTSNDLTSRKEKKNANPMLGMVQAIVLINDQPYVWIDGFLFTLNNYYEDIDFIITNITGNHIEGYCKKNPNKIINAYVGDHLLRSMSINSDTHHPTPNQKADE